MSVDYDEKRNFIRMAVECELTLRDPDTGQKFPGRCGNLSGSGLLVFMDDAPPMGSQLDVHIAPDKAVVPALDARVEVVRIEPGADGDYCIGLRIVEMHS